MPLLLSTHPHLHWRDDNRVFCKMTPQCRRTHFEEFLKSRDASSSIQNFNIRVHRQNQLHWLLPVSE